MLAKKQKGLLGKLLSFVITVAFILVLIVVIIGVQTIATVGNWVAKISIDGFDASQFAELTKDSEIPFLEGFTFEDFDVDPTETTVFDLVNIVLALSDGLSVDESEIVTNPATENDKTQIENKLDGQIGMSGGQKDYLSILTTPVVSSELSQVEYTPNEIAALCNLMIEQATDLTDGDLKFLADLNATVVEISLLSNEGAKQVKIIISLDISEIKAEIDQELPAFIANKLSNTLYLTCVGTSQVDTTNGELTTTSAQVVLNSYTQEQSDLILGVVANIANWQTDQDASTAIGNSICQVFDTIINNLGKVGLLEESESTYTADAIDVENGKIKLISHLN